MCSPISALALVSGLRSRSKRPANGLSMIATTATLRSGGSIFCPASIPISSKNVSVRLICIAFLLQSSWLPDPPMIVQRSKLHHRGPGAFGGSA